MGNLDYKQFSRRHRPHIHPPGATLFLTYRLAGSIPKATVREYKAKKEWLENQITQATKSAQNGNSEQVKRDKLKLVEQFERFKRQWFLRFEDVLHKAETGPMWMQDERVADAVAENLHKLDGDAYRLDAYTVMSNHVHALFQPNLSEKELRETFDETGHLAFIGEHPGLARIMHALKGRSARECNLIIRRTGNFWEHESFDHVVRAGRFNRTLRYILNNPVKAGLVDDWRKWRWNYCRKDLVDLMFDKLQFVANGARVRSAKATTN